MNNYIFYLFYIEKTRKSFTAFSKIFICWGLLFILNSIINLITSLLTGYKHLNRIGIVYIAISILHAYFNLPGFGSLLTQLLYMVSLPFTFLYIGFFLKSRQAKEAGGN